ncbi:hypothetical protein EV363DRAFT_1266801 [Boletus edulis]|uniref:F-box domain-containing protein n=1 Tax=Boletus edulis BED1 TaxID=1328754 RepID=A0AAD4BTT9_BOLED|nr:hypothetical protein EV363DRAFT_1266801 [Boletus edulis]KAF8439964.1 hypothetical protein L210DRAFT_3541276 [Boletus edulis BED1]
MSLPADVIYHIFSFLSPCEIVRFRQVSKKSRDLTHSHALWKEVYANARFSRPPGPFSWQSTRYLERTLVQSELVSKTWTSQPPKMLSRTLTNWKGRDYTWTVVLGRWCIFLEGNKIQCHDIDSDTYHSLYDGTTYPNFRFTAHMASTADINGHRVCLLLYHTNDQQSELRRLLAFRVNDNGFSEPEIIGWTHNGSQELDAWQSADGDGFRGSTPFITVRRYHPCLILDVRTRRSYRLPISEMIPNELANQSLADTWYNNVILTKTHVISVSMYTSGPSFDATVLIQAFVVPDSAIPHDVGELRLTHEVILYTYLHSSGLLRNSIVDPVTGSVNIRLLHVTAITPIAEESQLMCLSLALPKPVSNTDVLPISIRSQHLFGSSWEFEHYTVSDDGYVRGLLLTEKGPPYLGFSSVRKFTIDASREECAIAVSDPCPLDLPIQSEDIVLDGIRGRIHYIQDDHDVNVNEVVTIDLA